MYHLFVNEYVLLHRFCWGISHYLLGDSCRRKLMYSSFFIFSLVSFIYFLHSESVSKIRIHNCALKIYRWRFFECLGLYIHKSSWNLEGYVVVRHGFCFCILLGKRDYWRCILMFYIFCFCILRRKERKWLRIKCDTMLM